MNDKQQMDGKSAAARAFDQIRDEARGQAETELDKARQRVSRERRRRRRIAAIQTSIGIVAGGFVAFGAVWAASSLRPDLLRNLDIVSLFIVSVIGLAGALIAWIVHREQDLTLGLTRLSPQLSAAIRCTTLTYTLEQQLTQYIETFDQAKPADVAKEVLARLERWDSNVMCDQSAIAGQTVPAVLVEMECFVTGLARARLAFTMALQVDAKHHKPLIHEALVELRNGARAAREQAEFAQAILVALVEDFSRELGATLPLEIKPNLKLLRSDRRTCGSAGSPAPSSSARR